MELPVRGRLVVPGIIILGLILAGTAVWYRAAHRPGVAAAPAPARDIPGQGQRVVAEVLNASGGVGLARAATRRLRDAGIDVVYFGSEAAGLDSTEILVRRGDTDKAERVRRALGAGLIRTAPDSARLVDVTIRLGRDFILVGRDP